MRGEEGGGAGPRPRPPMVCTSYRGTRVGHSSRAWGDWGSYRWGLLQGGAAAAAETLSSSKKWFTAQSTVIRSVPVFMLNSAFLTL